MNINKASVVFLAFMSIYLSTAQADVITLEPSADAFVYSDEPFTNFGGWDRLLAGIVDSGGTYYKSLVRFDLSAIPDNSTITSAVFGAWCHIFYGSASSQLHCGRVSDDWEENTVNYHTCPPFGNSVTIDWPVSSEWISVDVTSYVADWISGEWDNHGFQLTQVNSSGECYAYFFAREWSEISYRPHLTIDFDPPATSPTPAPTEAPTPPPTPTTGIPPLGVDIVLSQSIFRPGDIFLLEAYISNPGPETYVNVPFVILLDAYGLYFWRPDWTENFNWENIETLGETIMQKTILNFQWPNEHSSADGLIFYGAILTEDFSDISGEYDWTTFGWAYP